MLVAWFRFKYPHLSVGGVAASAPVNLYPGQHKQALFYNITISTYQNFGLDSCGDKIEHALSLVSKYGSSQQGRGSLGQSFNLCTPITTLPGGVEKLLFYLKGALATMALADYPDACDFVTPMPAYPVRVGCSTMLGPAHSDMEVLSSLRMLINVFLNYTGQLPCHEVMGEIVGPPWEDRERLQGIGNITLAWNYQ
eukprot:gene5954-5842_t